jgi:hypothetical protein
MLPTSPNFPFHLRRRSGVGTRNGAKSNRSFRFGANIRARTPKMSIGLNRVSGLTREGSGGILAVCTFLFRFDYFLLARNAAFMTSAFPGSRSSPGVSAAPAEPACEGGEARDLDAEAAALLADIAAFDIEAARKRVQQVDARYTGIGASKAVYPEMSPVPDLPPVRVVESPPRPAPVVQPVVASAPASGGLLGQLKDEVANRKVAEGHAARRVDAARSALDRQLRAVFEYFHDLTSQLNYLKPQIARRYYFLDSDDAFCNLAWLEGYSDFRTQSEQDGGCIERVTLGYTLKGPGQRTLERAGGAVERLRQVLFDLGLKFECQERRNRQRELEHGAFTVVDEISVQVVWRADFESRTVVVESRNLERLGYASCILQPDVLGPPLLDEFGRLMLGRENAFRSYVNR